MNHRRILSTIFAILAAGLVTGCTTYMSQVENAPGRATTYNAPGGVGPISGIGIGSQDIISMTDKMMRDMLATPLLANAKNPPRIIVDSAYFKNESTDRINLDMMTDRLRVSLNRHSRGRMIFVGRNYADMVDKERTLADKGVVDDGTTPLAAKTLGADYRLGGRITSLDEVQQRSGITSRFTQIVFEMVDLKTGAIVWGGQYSFKKTAADDVIYR